MLPGRVREIIGTPSDLFLLWIQVQTYGMSVGMGQNISHGTSVGMGQNISHGTSVGMGQNISHGTTVGMGQNISHGTSVGMARNISHGTCVGMGQNISHPMMAFRAPKTLPKPYVCNMANCVGSGNCGRTFKYRFNLYKHQRSRHGAPHQLKPRTHGPGSSFYNALADRPR